jgi:catechol 2,3-dioxygenase-like lactoylglutathione lyase family enzyme
MNPTYTFDHVHLNAENLQETSDFYQRVFGMRHVRFMELGGRPSEQLEVGGVRVNITTRSPQHGGRGNAIDHFALHVSDFDASVESLRAQGVTFLAEPGRAGNLRTLFIQAPDGVVVEVLAPATD